jgi:hypothetical protein
MHTFICGTLTCNPGRSPQAKLDLPLCLLSHRLAGPQPVMNSDVILRSVALVVQRFLEPVAARRGIQAK